MHERLVPGITRSHLDEIDPIAVDSDEVATNRHIPELEDLVGRKADILDVVDEVVPDDIE